jgi:signal-transduction protein with cAMP-binding, CBS, and nucleotidyltransferase domain
MLCPSPGYRNHFPVRVQCLFCHQNLYMRTVQHILDAKAKPFNQVTPDTLVIDALSQLNSLNLSYLIVMGNDAYKGIFSERDYSRKVILKGRHSNSTTVEEVMSTDVPVIAPSDTVEQCMVLMEESKSRYLLVFDEDKKLLGVITIHDILRQVLKDKSQVFDMDLAQRLVDEDEHGYIY